MDIMKILHHPSTHLLTHLSTPSKVCLILSVIAWFVALVLVYYLQANPETGRKQLFDLLIVEIFLFGMIMLYLGTHMLPIGISLMMMTFYVLFFFVVCKVPSPFSGKG